MNTDIPSPPLLYGKYILIHEGNRDAPIQSSIVCDGKDFYIIKKLNNDYVITIDLKNCIHDAIEEWKTMSIHPHVVGLKESGETEGSPYLIIEYVSNGIYPWHSLEACFRTRGASPSRILYWLIQIAHVLQNSYRSNDDITPVITPGNILIGADGRALLTNCGGIHLAGILGILTFIPATHLAPEQHNNQTYADLRTCVYHFGITLYQALRNGQVPFTAELPQGKSRDALIEYHRALLTKKTNWNYHAYLREPSLKNFHSILQRCLDPNPDGRYSNINDLIKDLEKAYETLYDLPCWSKPVPPEIWPLFNRGAANLEIHEYETAAQCFSDCVEKTNHPSALLYLGLALEGCNKTHEAVEYLQQATKEYPSEPEFHYQLGMLLLKRGDNLQARQSFEQARRLDPDDKRLPDALGAIYAREQEYERALECFVTKRSSTREHAFSSQQKGFELKELGYYEEALNCLNEALNDNENKHTIELEECRAYCFMKTGRFHEAESTYAEIASSREDSASFWFHYGQTLESLHKYENALSCYKRAEELLPHDPAIPFRRGRILKTLMRLDEAVEAFNKVLALNKEDSFALNGKGECLYIMKDLSRALDCFIESLRLSPQDPIAMKYKTYCLIGLGRNEEALEAISDALTRYPNDPYLKKSEGDILLLNKDYLSATKSYMQYLKTNYNDATVWIRLALSFLMLGETKEASECSNFAINIDPHNKEVLIAKAQLEYAIGNKEEAVNLFIHYLSIAPHDNDIHIQWIAQKLNTISEQESSAVRLVRKFAIDYAQRSQATSPYQIQPSHLFLALATVCTKKLDNYLNKQQKYILDTVNKEIFTLIDFLHENRIDIATFEEMLRKALKIHDTSLNRDMLVYPSQEVKEVMRSAHDFSHDAPMKLIHLFGGLLLIHDPIIEPIYNTLSIDPKNALRNLKYYLSKDHLLDEIGEIEKHLNKLLPEILQKSLGNQWEEIVLRNTFNDSRQKELHNKAKKNKKENIIEAMTFGEKRSIIEKYWDHFKNDFPLDPDEFLNPRDHKNSIISLFDTITLCRNTLVHHRSNDSCEKESLIADGILAVNKIKKCIKRRKDHH